ncbi:UNVERIFIED_CONTAM: hypothetical protein Sindi_1827300 [Sesamum indicum]
MLCGSRTQGTKKELDPKEGPSNIRNEGSPSHRPSKEVPPSKCEKSDDGKNEDEKVPSKVQPMDELMNIKIVSRDLEKFTCIGSQLEGTIRKEIIKCLHHNMDIFAWTPQDLEGIDPTFIHLNIDPHIKPVKQKKRCFVPEKDKIIQAEVDKLLVASHIEQIQFPEWLSNGGVSTQAWRKVTNVHQL